MREINFKELRVEVGIDQFQTRDLRKEVGNALHRASESVPMSDLARQIYYSEGSIRISEECFSEMLNLLRPAFKKFVFDAFLGVSEVSEKEEA